MQDRLSDTLKKLPQAALDALARINRGIEKEGLRTDAEGFIAHTDHPRALGHALTHDAITTDYSEALLELITPVCNSQDELLTSLEEVHRFVQQNLDDELFWAGSMPCRLDGDESIRIAEYGESNIGRLKHVYRQGLAVRYGRIMQSIAGLHYNFSLPDSFWQALHTQDGSELDLKDYKSVRYFSLIRNFRRYSWLLMYLFGASPALDKTFLDGKPHRLEPFTPDTFYLPYATSLRMGDLGYHNNAQSSLKVCFNSLKNFIATLSKALKTPYPAYEKIGTRRGDEYIQINANILQIENEYYSVIRPKRVTRSGEKPLHALQARGVEYVEVRCLDLDPFQPFGIDPHTVAFLDAFLLTCLLNESPIISDAECDEIDDNFARVVAEGRHPELQLKWHGSTGPLQQYGQEILEMVQQVAEIMDRQHATSRYHDAVARQREKLQSPELTPSGHMVELMRSENLGYLELIRHLSEKHQIFSRSRELPPSVSKKYNDMSDSSFLQEQEVREFDSSDFSQFLADFQV